MPESATSSDSVEICLTVSWEIEVDDNVNSLDVYSPCAKIRTHKTSTLPFPEPMEYFIPLLLGHFSVDIKAGISKLNNFLGK